MRFVDRKIFCLDEKQIEAGQLRFNLLGQLALLRKANAFDRSREESVQQDEISKIPIVRVVPQ